MIDLGSRVRVLRQPALAGIEGVVIATSSMGVTVRLDAPGRANEIHFWPAVDVEVVEALITCDTCKVAYPCDGLLECYGELSPFGPDGPVVCRACFTKAADALARVDQDDIDGMHYAINAIYTAHDEGCFADAAEAARYTEIACRSFLGIES